MPRALNPGDLKLGHGKPAPSESAPRPSLTGAGLAGPGPNFGQPVVPAGAMPGGLTGGALAEHVQDPKAAHQASAIEHDGAPDILISGNVEGALDELIGTVTRRPPYLGQWLTGLDFNCIPDWGTLKLRDASLENYDQVAVPPGPLANLPSGISTANVFPYYFSAPGPAQDVEFTNPGEDPRSDWVWNTGLEATGQLGMGYGKCHIGAFTRGGDAGPAPLEMMRTARLFPRATVPDAETGMPAREPVTLSGSIFPADRGVLALFHFPPASVDMQTDFLAQPLVTDETVIGGPTGRVVAALLLGNGILGDKCQSGATCSEAHPCDGAPGGIFAVGTDPVSSKYNPFTFPGRATGQYDLKELHLGVNVFGDDLVPPWNDLDGDTVTGASRTATATIPAPGQVRLGTDPDAGETPVDYGIPILGGTADYFDVAPVAQLGSLGSPIKGDSLILSSNFFGYRLPVLKDYSQETGLKWTPRGEDYLFTTEVHRFFAKTTPLSTTYPDGDLVSASNYLRTAGFYEAGFDEDYWTWQIARYRHTFLMPSTAVLGNREEVGSYWLVHFKREADFEKFARDGIFPWDATDGYEVYGYSLAGSPPVHIEEDGNVVNEWPDATAPVSPNGPAPEYGYAADQYHGLRSTILMDPAGTALPATTTAEYTWASSSIPGTEAIMWVSGVAYHTPRFSVTGNASWLFTAIDLVLDAGFWTSFRTDQKDLTVEPSTSPAILASVNPLFLNMAPWAYGPTSGFGAIPVSLTVPTGLPGVGFIPDTRYLGTHRIEVPFQYLGSNGSGTFSDTNGPLDADGLTLSLPADIEAIGDGSTPSFTRDAVMRAYLRRPLNHIADDTTTLPFTTADGHGQELAPMDGVRVLYHSTRFSKNHPTFGIYGNYVVAAVGAPPNTSYSGLSNVTKDYTEKFLDETHRLDYRFNAAIIGAGGNPYTADAVSSLVGPGMGGWVGGPIEVPVRASQALTPWDTCSWLLMEHHLDDLTLVSPGTESLQVTGLPDRNPPQSAAVSVPFPSSGVLQYPQEDFTAVSPQGGVYFAGAQPDYSAAVGTRNYVRAFDAAFVHTVVGAPGPISVVGTSSVKLRIDGVTKEDLGYAAPGPGGVGNNRLAILVKVPGLTTWMDIGRPDGAGPSKQDMFADGAGCQVAGPNTYNFQDPVTGLVGCYIEVNVGPAATLFINPGLWSDYVGAATTVGEAPVLVKVVMDDTAKGYDLAHTVTGLGTFDPVVNPGEVPNMVRGLVGIRVVHPNDTLLDPV